MEVVILAAGQATRLRPLTDDRPKCLLEVGGRPIISRAVALLAERGLDRITIVDGYRGDMIRAALDAEFPGVDFRYIRNADYATTNNAWSLHLAASLPPGPFMLLDADIVFAGDVLDLLLAHPAANRLALRSQGGVGDEEMKVALDAQGRVRALGKELEPSAAAGESVGIEVFGTDFAGALWPVLRRRLLDERRLGEYYESSFLELVRSGHDVVAVDIGALPCREIDTPADLEEARAEFGGH
jgi:choline kinase